MRATYEPKSDSTSQADGAAGKTSAAEKSSETVVDPILNTLNRVQGVEGMGNDRKAATDYAIGGSE
jgi:hypothetical protein